jgi:GTP-binding protein
MGEPFAIKSAEFVTSAMLPKQYPQEPLPEVAFAGRSNVGKSSLINCLVQRRNLVRTSRTPGRTQMLNFFRVNGLFHFVDLPGYGFAKVSAAVHAKWGPMMEAYFEKSRNLKGVVHILDVRHPPSADDLRLWGYFSARAIPVLPVLTKADKLSRTRCGVQAAAIAGALGIDPSELTLFSAETRLGRDELLGKIAELFGIA